MASLYKAQPQLLEAPPAGRLPAACVCEAAQSHSGVPDALVQEDNSRNNQAQPWALTNLPAGAREQQDGEVRKCTPMHSVAECLSSLNAKATHPHRKNGNIYNLILQTDVKLRNAPADITR